RLDLLLDALRAGALLQHDQAVRATARHLRRSGVRHHQLLDAPVVHALPHFLFHPHATATRAAAEAALAMVRCDLPALHPWDRIEHRTRLVIDAVVTAQVARVVVRDDIACAIAQRD